MERFIRPEKFEGRPDTTSAQWNHWFKTFSWFLTKAEAADEDKLGLLINHISPEVYEHINECVSYNDAIRILKSVYVKPVNTIFARYQLSTRKQQSHETLDQFVQALRVFAKDCKFAAQSLQERSDEAIMDAFIAGISSSNIRQRLLENSNLSLETAIQQARSLDLAQRNSDRYSSEIGSQNLVAAISEREISDTSENEELLAVNLNRKCMFCGNLPHHRSKCPARNADCFKCSKKGHFSKVCRSTGPGKNHGPNKINHSVSALLASVEENQPATFFNNISINGKTIEALIDTGSTSSFISGESIAKLNLPIYPSSNQITLAAKSTCTTIGYSFANIELNNSRYENVKLNVLKDLCTQVILGRDFMSRHSAIEFKFPGDLPKLTFCSVAEMNINPPSLFSNLSPECRPIRISSRKFSSDDQKFIKEEIAKLLEDGIIEKSSSPWRAQVLVAGGITHKKRLVVDYSQTINKFTYLDAYPAPNINDLVHTLAQNEYFSKLDLKSAYHQVPLMESERHYTAFEADKELYQFTRIPFGITNAVAKFQRLMNEFIKSNSLENTYAYIDDIIICGKTVEEHNTNLEKFMNAAIIDNITINKDKSEFLTTEIKYLGHCISKDKISPDPDRLKSLIEMAVPNNSKSLQRCLGMFSYYSKWIPNYSNKISPLLNLKMFPLTREQKESFEMIKGEICKASIAPISEGIPFEVETDASDVALAGTLSQNKRPIAFYSRTFNKSEKSQSSVEKEALAIVECVRHWRHFLVPKKFKVITDQKPVSFMFSRNLKSRIKSDKISRWRLELSMFDYDICFRPGIHNVSADALSRICSATGVCSLKELERLHSDLCHPGIARLNHFVKSKNLPFSLIDVKKVCEQCNICAEIKPKFYRTPSRKLVHAVRPFERISMDFVGPKVSSTRNKYLLVMVDEYSRFPFAFPCPDTSAKSVIDSCQKLYSLFGTPTSIHCDRAKCFMSQEVKEFMYKNGILLTHSTPYHPTGNSQCERTNGTVWRTVLLALRSQHLPESSWETVLPTVLHSMRSMLCTSTNCTPHERIFQYQRKSSSGYTLPQWLSSPGKVLVRKFVRSSKSDPLVEPAELIEANPSYSKIRYPNGREGTVSTGDLAKPGLDNDNDMIHSEQKVEPTMIHEGQPEFVLDQDQEERIVPKNDFEGFIPSQTIQSPLRNRLQDEVESCKPRRSERIRKAPDRYGY